MNKKTCPWCKYLPNGCGDDCDFRSLPFEKDAIIKRIQEEMAEIDTLKKNIERDASAVNTVMDKAFGIGLMSKVLKSEFKMKQGEINKVLGNEMSLFERTKLMAKLAMMKRQRGK